ncbi:MAG: precorrin-2 C(20)-methyltransferase [Deltaproteobacteria bacterium]|jgi:precorrin-2/cobalt-factor-2 C20-methyltransferase|nr:precorrin-2 C(20)-methyltransferase [Deltaproteobacteria bacterium]
MTQPFGTLYGLGVGPGDPDLLTIKAAKILNSVDAVFTASSSKNEYSLAYQIASPHLKSGIKAENLDFPMTDKESELLPAWVKNATTIAEVLKSGKSAAFLTLGDPLTYSTYSYIIPVLKNILTEVNIVTIPAVTSYQLAAAKLNRPLCINKESLTIVSGTGEENGYHNFVSLLDSSDNLVIMKSPKDRGKVFKLLKEKNLESKIAVCSQLGLPEEKITQGVPEDLTNNLSYFTLILVNKR